MGIPFLLALSISSRQANSLLHFLKCVLSRPVPPCVPVVICFMKNLYFVQVTVVFSSFCTKNFHTKDLLTRIAVFEKVGKEGTSSCSGGGKFLELELLPPPLIFFLSDIGLLPLFLSKFMFKFKVINIMKNKQDNITKKKQLN
ncbi:hypothetical protein H5410_013352 [Solanum commersonii]|uniref:Uncharacterized protein n=1 Tax=Solanum commersonii TaxID=4109 RepID=A0A9J6AUC9_SOLCO|nr:hypothetical protein H5410_013352 [Solanum commersonii]